MNEPNCAVPFEAFITNLGKYNEGNLVGEWISFPATKEKVDALLKHIGIDGVRYEEFFITDYDMNVMTDNGTAFGEYESLSELNYLANELYNMNHYELEKYEAIIEIGDVNSLQDCINLTANLDCYDYLGDVHNNYDLGRYWIDESGCYDLKAMDTLANYIDYEAFGRDVAMDEGGSFTSRGYVYENGETYNMIYTGDKDEIPEEYRLLLNRTNVAEKIVSKKKTLHER